MQRVLIVHASRHGGTAGIAQRIGDTMKSEGIEVVVARAADLPDPAGYDACLVGSGVYMGSWLKEGTNYLEQYSASLAGRPIWLFSSGPLPGSTKETKDPAVDPIENALGPAEGPGSGGRRKVEELAGLVRARDHRVFRGAYDPTDPPKAMSERFVRMMPGSKGILPVGDFRDWDAVEAWAHELAKQIAGPVPVA